ncbi:MAG: TIGR01906 family membrane protein [Clostridia bacterium]|nr:TIGR01906 family membrane protein [Clostridia bacterium]
MNQAGRRTAAVAGFCFLFTVILLVTVLTIYNIAGDKDTLATQMRRHSVPEYSGLPDEEYPEMGKMIAVYLTGGGKTFQYSFTDAEGNTVECFSSREAEHMADCRDLIALAGRFRWYLGIAGLILLGVGAILWKHMKSFANGMLAGFGVALAIGLALLIWGMISFDGLFTAFHKLAFTNDLWLMNPETDMIIRLMPGTFFRSLGIKVLLAIVPAALASLAAAVILRIIGGNVNEEERAARA